MSSEDKFREKLRDLVESKEFTFDESNWERAKLLFEQEDRRGNAGLWLTSLFLFMISGMAWFALHGELAQNRQLAEKSPAITRMDPAPAPIPQTGPAERLSEPRGIEPGPAQQPARAYRPATPRTRQAPTAPVTIAPADHEAVPAPSEPVSSPLEPIATSNPQSASPGTPVASNNNPGSEPERKEANPLVTTVVTVTPAQVTPTPETKPAEETVASVPPAPSTTAAVTAVKPDTVKTIVYVPVPSRNMPMLSLEAGVNVNPGWKNDGQTDARSITPVFALHYHNQVADKLQMTLGVQFQQISKLSYSSMTSKVTRLGLGEESRVTVITPQRLQFIGVPLKFHYQPDSLQSFGIGYHLNYLLNVDAGVVKYTDRNGAEEDRESYTYGGYVEGFRTFSSQASVFYCRRVHKLFSVNAELLFGLGDLKADGFFGIAQKERHHAFRLSLIYDLQKK